MGFFISLFLGIQAEALRAIIIDLASERVPTGEAFHLFLVAPGDLILGIVTQEEVGADGVRDFTLSDVHLNENRISWKECIPFSLHPQGLKHSIFWIGIEAGLEFCKQLTGDAGDIADTGHWQKYTFCPGVKGYLEGLSQVLH